MSSSASRKERDKKSSGSKSKRSHKRDYSDDEKKYTPRRYDETYQAPEEELSKLNIANRDDRYASPADQSHTTFNEDQSENDGWSEWIWYAGRECYYRSRSNSAFTDGTEYEYKYPETPGGEMDSTIQQRPSEPTYLTSPSMSYSGNYTAAPTSGQSPGYTYDYAKTPVITSTSDSKRVPYDAGDDFDDRTTNTYPSTEVHRSSGFAPVNNAYSNTKADFKSQVASNWEGSSKAKPVALEEEEPLTVFRTTNSHSDPRPLPPVGNPGHILVPPPCGCGDDHVCQIIISPTPDKPRDGKIEKKKQSSSRKYGHSSSRKSEHSSSRKGESKTRSSGSGPEKTRV